ncbi:hypothetical protein KYI13_12775 (plasmid) [Macrococcoides bohemicum]|uniref:antitoxin VbhA family protein n=1 Tax=Macrococcoides bohemicum TaxID=1903056 RepID=UPI001C605933|nr:hypothetical protein [Macrococcus bohemicus]QYA46055.1 hypothetical protein KYI13_12775 [Macrococcus bohemicus]
MLNVNLENIKKFFESDISTKQISEYSNLAYTTTDNLRKGLSNLENATFRTLVKLSNGYEKYIKNLSINDPGHIELDRRKRHVEVAIRMNDIDGNVLSEEYIQKFYDYANGKISKAEFNEYVTYESHH